MLLKNAAQVVDLVRQIRHDYLNHFQVVSGYLELGMPERAQSYINDIVADAVRERELLSLSSAETGLLFYQLYMHYRVQGIILEFVPIELEDWALACLGHEIENLIREQGWRPPDEEDLILEVKLEIVNANSIRLAVTEKGTDAGRYTLITRE